MTAWTNPTSADAALVTATSRGILRPEELARHVEVGRTPPGTAAERWVENRWSLAWDLPDGRWYPSQVLPHPTVSLTVELGSHPRAGIPVGEPVLITGVVTTRFDVEVRGWGRVAGLRFRPGGLAAITGRSSSDWTDRTIAARDALPDDLCTVLAHPDLARSPDEWAAAAEAGLLELAPELDPRYDLLLDVIARMLVDHTILSVAEVAEGHGLTVRTLQRLFTHYVGVGPKAVLARYRMHDVVNAIDQGYDGTLTDLAHRFGWYDQAHFTRDFTALVGVTPSAYRDRAARP